MSIHDYMLIASAVQCITVIAAIVSYAKRIYSGILTARKILIVGTFIAILFLMYPFYMTDEVRILRGILFLIFHVGSLFFLNFRTNIEIIAEKWGDFPLYYMIFVSAYHLITPALSAAVILSFIKRLVSIVQYGLSFRRKVHVFSELNEKTLALGRSLYEKYNGPQRQDGKKRIAIVYAGVVYENDAAHQNLIRGAKDIKAILFDQEILSIHFKRKKGNICFYLIASDEQGKVRCAESLIGIYKNNPNASLYIYSDSVEVKCFLSMCDPKIRMRLIRVDDIKALIYWNLDKNGLRLFEDARTLPDGTREIFAVVVGFGRYGMEVTRSLLWYAQLPGYRVRLHVFDERKTAKSEFRAMCPEIILNENMDEEGDMRYTVRIENAIFGTEHFYSRLESLGKITYVFVCLGTDRQNVTAATGIKIRLKQRKRSPYIETIVYDTNLKECLNAGNDTVKAFGDLRSFYSEPSVIGEELQSEALSVHKRWSEHPNDPSEENGFFMNDYSYYSSLTSAVHRRLRAKIAHSVCSLGPLDQLPEENRREMEEKTKRAFSFYYASDLSKNMLDRVNDNENITALSKEMKAFADLMYIRIAYLRYARLSIEERKRILVRLHLLLVGKIFGKIRFALTDGEAKALMKHLEEKAETFEDALSYLKSEEFIRELKKKVQEKTVLNDVKKVLKEIRPLDDLPMFSDKQGYIDGYGDCLERIDPDDKDCKETFSRLRKILDVMIELETADLKDEKRKREAIRAFELGPFARTYGIPEEDILGYVAGKLKKPLEAMARYFEKAKWYAGVEHIRWNAYMRTEGFRRSGTTDKPNKLHYDLVPVDMLTVADCVKDI